MTKKTGTYLTLLYAHSAHLARYAKSPPRKKKNKARAVINTNVVFNQKVVYIMKKNTKTKINRLILLIKISRIAFHTPFPAARQQRMPVTAIREQR